MATLDLRGSGSTLRLTPNGGSATIRSFLVVGPKGDQGIQGIKGDQGIQGIKGDQGIQGLKGDTGPTGLPGVNAVANDTATGGYVSTPGSATDSALKAAYTQLTSVAATATASATLVANRHTPVDATSAARTMTLPTAPAGAQISVEKIDASVNAVNVTGTMRGAAAQTIALTAQYDARTFLSEGGGSWRPVSDHRTKTALDAAYGTRTGSKAVGQGELIYSVKDGTPLVVGAKGDGTTNDTAAIHAVRDLAGVNGRVYFPSGTYRVSQIDANKAGQTWTLHERAVVKVIDGAGGCNFVVTAADVTIQGGTIDGNAAAVTGGAGVYAFAGSDRCTVRDTTIINTWGRGIDANTTGFTARRVKVLNSLGDGILVFPYSATQGDLEDVVIENCFVDRRSQTTKLTQGGVSAVGIMVSGGRSQFPGIKLQRPKLLNNTVLMPPDSVAAAGNGVALTVGNFSYQAVVTGNTTLNGGIGISVEGGEHATISANTIKGAGCGTATPSFGIELAGVSWAAVSGNTVDGQGVTARGIANSNAPLGPVSLTGNTVRNALVALEVPSGGYGGEITGNVVDGFTQTGIRVNAAASASTAGLTLAGNNISAGPSTVVGAIGVHILDASNVTGSANILRNMETGFRIDAATAGFTVDKLLFTANILIGVTTPVLRQQLGGTLGAEIRFTTNVGIPDTIPAPGSLFVSGFFYGPQFGAVSSAAVVAGSMTAYPFLVSRGGGLTVTQASVEVSTAAVGATLRFGIYADAGGQPGALIQEFTSAGALDASTVGSKTVTGLTRLLPPGLYWVAVVAQGGTPTLAISTGQSPYVGRTTPTTGGHTTAYSLTGVTGALPATFGAPSGTNYAINATLKAA